MFSWKLMVAIGLMFSAEGACPDNWSAWGGKCYRYFDLDKDFYEASQYCRRAWRGDYGYASLVAINSWQENDFVSYLSAGKSYKGKGGDTWINHRTYKCPSCEFDGYSNFRKGQPNNSGGKEDCVHTNFHGRGEWNDEACYKKHAFVCKL